MVFLHMDIRKVAGSNIRLFRQNRGMTLQNLSDVTGMSRTYLTDIELGKKAITIVRLEKIAKALKIKTNVLLIPKAFQIPKEFESREN